MAAAKRGKLPKPVPPQVPASMAGVEHLRERRIRPARELSLGPIMDAMLGDARRSQRGLAGIAEVWNATVPAALLPKTTLVAFARGQLTVRVDDASARFALDRFLRAGGERTIIAASRIPLRSIRLAT